MLKIKSFVNIGCILGDKVCIILGCILGDKVCIIFFKVTEKQTHSKMGSQDTASGLSFEKTSSWPLESHNSSVCICPTVLCPTVQLTVLCLLCILSNVLSFFHCNCQMYGHAASPEVINH